MSGGLPGRGRGLAAWAERYRMPPHVRILSCSCPAASPPLGAVFADLVCDMSGERQYGWMWVEACEVLDRAERLQRQFLRYVGPGADAAVWEPPVDIQETDDGLILLFAIPGVVPEEVSLVLEPTELTVSAMRPLKLAHPDAVIRRLEIPHGRFFRRIPLAGVPLKLTAS